MSDPIVSREPVRTADDRILAASALEDTVRIWSYVSDEWAVSDSVQLDQAVVFPGGEPSTLGQNPEGPVDDRIIVDDRSPDDIRLLVPVILGNSIGVAALAERNGAWAPLPFETESGSTDYGYDVATNLDGRLTWFYNDCSPDCATGNTSELPVARWPDGYRLPRPPTTSAAPTLVPGAACTPGSSPDCVDQYGDGNYLYIVGFADCAAVVDSSSCIDLDGDGRAGYPDSG